MLAFALAAAARNKAAAAATADDVVDTDDTVDTTVDDDAMAADDGDDATAADDGDDAMTADDAVTAAPAWTRARLQALIDDFVALHAGIRQREAGWYRIMGTTVGGSELAALMDVNPYSSFEAVAKAKEACLRGVDTFQGGPACWWGSLFEDVVALVIEVDLGAPVVGDSICIQVVDGHRNSPDGYVVAGFRRGPHGLELVTTLDPAVAAGAAESGVEWRVLLLEFKCPHTRAPTGSIPPQYIPQVWSGLAVSPPAHFGLFVDSVFRKCALSDLGPSTDYDRVYHNRDRVDWSPPLAWGLVHIFAPEPSAPRRVRYGWAGDVWAPGDPVVSDYSVDADAAIAAQDIHCRYFGLARPRPEMGPVDLGDCPPAMFVRTLGLVARGAFKARPALPVFADGRGGGSLGAPAAAPAGYWEVGVLPWKLFNMVYDFVLRRPDFLDEVRPLIAALHARVAAGVAAPPAAPRGADVDLLAQLYDS